MTRTDRAIEYLLQSLFEPQAEDEWTGLVKMRCRAQQRVAVDPESDASQRDQRLIEELTLALRLMEQDLQAGGTLTPRTDGDVH